MSTSFEKILRLLVIGPKNSSQIAESLNVSIATVKRYLAKLLSDEVICNEKNGRWIQYSLTIKGRLSLDYDLDTYFRKEQDDRQAQTHFNFDVIESLKTINLFS